MFGGTLLPSPEFATPTLLDQFGETTLRLQLPGALADDWKLYIQAWIHDSEASYELSATNGLVARNN